MFTIPGGQDGVHDTRIPGWQLYRRILFRSEIEKFSAREKKSIGFAIRGVRLRFGAPESDLG